MIVSALVSLGLIVSFHCFVLYAGETVAVLANDGILPEWLGATHPRFDTPHIALFFSSLLGLGLLALTVTAMAGQKAVSVLINVAVVGGLVAYILQFLAYLSRPWASSGSGFRSPLGRPGAYVGLSICVMLLGCAFYHATVEVTEAEGLLASTLVFVVALGCYYVGPRHLSKGVARKRTNSQAMMMHMEEEEEEETAAVLAMMETTKPGMGGTMVYEEDASRPGILSFLPLSPCSPPRRRQGGGGGSNSNGSSSNNNNNNNNNNSSTVAPTANCASVAGARERENGNHHHSSSSSAAAASASASWCDV